MIPDYAWTRLYLAALGVLVIGAAGCAVGAALDVTGFFRAWLCTFLFWLGIPLAGVTLVLVHDLSGGEWMGTARPLLNAAIATMPIASLAGIPAFIGLHSLYSWTHPAPSLGNTFYLNVNAFLLRYAVYIVLWNLLAAFALWAPRGERTPIPPALSWLSGVALALLAVSTGFASIDWILSLEPAFWSSIFPMTVGAGWFNTGLALVLFIIATVGWPAGERRDHMADIAAILLATTIFWAYVEFMQFLIIWEENLKSEIPWYLLRITTPWARALSIAVGFGFFVPFFALLTQPGKRSRGVVATVCFLILISRVADKWWLVLPEFAKTGPLWLDAAAIFALGGLMMLLYFAAGWPRVRRRSGRSIMAELEERVEDNPDTAYEQSDWPLGMIGLVLLGTLILLVIAPFVLIGAFPGSVSDVSRALTVEPPQPRLQKDPSEDLAKFMADEDKRLNSYYWIDKKKGIVHIPIEQAMKEITEEGIDGFPRGKP
jgi:hypothetical protein